VLVNSPCGGSRSVTILASQLMSATGARPKN
jgi:hypothetical protein